MPQPRYSTEGFPLKVLLDLYGKNSRTLYTDYFAGFKLLASFLSPLVFTVPSHVPDIQWFDTNYETQQLAQILGIDIRILLYVLKDTYHEL